ncbi:hypothetical protein BU26DRAFT_187451 [Trematosphaeria pertusa]|uniref:Uncharacterized protein n=1 Tax=Trematosphaeria pertusa TaxID=390896 RepID=A0A6A6HSD8_9PLEO|nr:uncharacterized protein BU26DRAFT_187451 [Trematosphaeria pertusa]KAF2241094.1 hypothetical protein BU26DRAFT_187451 [Trematosphaeria pertusa]
MRPPSEWLNTAFAAVTCHESLMGARVNEWCSPVYNRERAFGVSLICILLFLALFLGFAGFRCEHASSCLEFECFSSPSPVRVSPTQNTTRPTLPRSDTFSRPLNRGDLASKLNHLDILLCVPKYA